MKTKNNKEIYSSNTTLLTVHSRDKQFVIIISINKKKINRNATKRLQ